MLINHNRIHIQLHIGLSHIEKAVKFYEMVFGLKLGVHNWGEEKMVFFPKEEVNVWGAVIQSAGYQPNENGVIISLDADGQMDEMLKKIETLGGAIVKGRCKTREDREDHFAIIKDTEGNRIRQHSID